MGRRRMCAYSAVDGNESFTRSVSVAAQGRLETPESLRRRCRPKGAQLDGARFQNNWDH